MSIKVMGQVFQIRSIQFLVGVPHPNMCDSVLLTYIDSERGHDVWMQMSQDEFNARVRPMAGEFNKE